MSSSMTFVTRLVFHEINSCSITFDTESMMSVASTTRNLSASSCDYSWTAAFSASANEINLRKTHSVWIMPIIRICWPPSVTRIWLITPTCCWSIVPSLVLVLSPVSIWLLSPSTLILTPISVGLLLLLPPSLIGVVIVPSLIWIVTPTALVRLLLPPSLIRIIIVPSLVLIVIPSLVLIGIKSLLWSPLVRSLIRVSSSLSESLTHFLCNKILQYK